MAGGTIAAALNRAREGLGRKLAIESAPVRMNMIPPAWTMRVPRRIAMQPVGI